MVSRKPIDKQTGFNQEMSNGISPEIPVKIQPVVKQQAAEKIFIAVVILFKRVVINKGYCVSPNNLTNY